MISEEDIKAFERRLAMFQYTHFSGGTRNFLQKDVPDFIAAVRQMLNTQAPRLDFQLAPPSEWTIYDGPKIDVPRIKR
jgi:hypothetical protein